MARSTKPTRRPSTKPRTAAPPRAKASVSKPKPAAKASPVAASRKRPAARQAKPPARAPARAAAPRAPVQSKQELRDRIEKLERANANLRAKNREATEAARTAAERVDALEEELAGLRRSAPSANGGATRKAAHDVMQSGDPTGPITAFLGAQNSARAEPEPGTQAVPARAPRAMRKRRAPAAAERDPGDAVPPGVAPLEPSPLDAEAEAAKHSLEEKLSDE